MPSSSCAPSGRSAPSTRCRRCTTRSAGSWTPPPARGWSRSRGGTGCSSSRTPPTPISAEHAAAPDRGPRTGDHRLRVRAVEERRHRPARRLRRGPSTRWCPPSNARSARPPGTPPPSSPRSPAAGSRTAPSTASRRDKRGDARTRQTIAREVLAGLPLSATRRPTSCGSRCPRRSRRPDSGAPCAPGHLGLPQRSRSRRPRTYRRRSGWPWARPTWTACAEALGTVRAVVETDPYQ